MKTYSINVTQLAQEDLQEAKLFYDAQDLNLGNYFIDSILVDLESLGFYGGIHSKIYGYYKMLAKRFPFAIYYDIEDDSVIVHAILHTRKNPTSIKARLYNLITPQ
jgi:plasmid stabilization system protein ParE